MKSFRPKISQSEFKDEITRILSQEGNNGRIVSRIKAELLNFQRQSFYNGFWKACEVYKIKHRFNVVESEGSAVSYQLLLLKNNREWFQLQYDELNRDVTIEFAKKSYELLSIEIANRLFFEENL